jgi:hypothetical protein
MPRHRRLPPPIERKRVRGARHGINFYSVFTIRIPRLRHVSLRFGKPFRSVGRLRGERVHYFAPESVFGLIRWHGNEYGSTFWQLSILRAVLRREAASTILGVSPGAEILLNASSFTNVRCVLTLISKIKARGIAAIDVSPDYWRCVHHRLVARVVVPEYSAAEHAAYLGRLRCVP